MKSRHSHFVLLGLLAASPSAFSGNLDDWFSLEGFGTVGTYRADSPVATVKVDDRESTGSLDQTRFDGDTQLAVQAKVRFNDDLKGVLQLISKKNAESSDRPAVNWAYLDWDISNELGVKFGRSVAPIFLMSDYRDLNYSQTMVRPPIEPYGENPITYQDGVNALWEKNIGPGELSIEGFFGKSQVDVGVGTVTFNRASGLSSKWAQGPVSLRIGYSAYKFYSDVAVLSAEVSQLSALPASVCTNCAEVVPVRALLTNLTGAITTIGAVYDQDNVLLQAEYMRRTTNSSIAPNQDAGYLMAAYRIGKFTPYTSYAQLTSEASPFNLQPGPGAPAGFATELNYLNQSLLGYGYSDAKTYTIGARWDFAKNVALKAQIDHIVVDKPDVGSSVILVFPTSLLGTPNGFGGNVNLFTLNLDFIF